jgi:hypothetical protein
MGARRKTETVNLRPDSVQVQVRDELYMMLVSTVRYSMGRQTYMVGEACNLVRKFWKVLDRGMKEVVLRDLNHELELCDRLDRKLGADFDHREWVSLRDDMTKKFNEEYRDGESR